MLYTVTNGSRHPRVVYAAGRGVLVPMGASRQVEMSEAEAENAAAAGVTIAGAKAEKAPPASDLTASELLAKVGDMPFLSFKSAAAKILGAECPAKKDEIVAALQAKAA